MSTSPTSSSSEGVLRAGRTTGIARRPARLAGGGVSAGQGAVGGPGGPGSREASGGPSGAGAAELTEVHPVRFGELAPEAAAEGGSNLNLLLDVVVEVSVELGRARLTLGELMELKRGSVIQLDKLAGEPADVLVNGKPIAKGEVVLLDEKFGVKINDIVTRARRARELP